MPKVLLVDTDADSRESLERALAGAGYGTAVARSGSAALEVLARERPDLIVTQAWLGDVDATQLVASSRGVSRDGHVPFLLLAGSHAAIGEAAAGAGVDRVCAGHISVPGLLKLVAEMIGPGARPAPAARPATPLAPAAPVAPAPVAPPPVAPSVTALASAPAPEFQGSLQVMDLPARVQAISRGATTGRLTLSLALGEGVVTFDRGLPVHADFAGGQGEAAFAALVWASQAEGGTFRFEPDTGGIATEPRTIHRSAERLLLDVAAWLDEARLAAGAAEASASRPARE